METFASGWTRNYYGKGDVVVYRLDRGDSVPVPERVFGARVLLLVYGEAFWPTYTTGDNTGLIATDSMKNFIQRETLNFAGHDLGRLLPVPRRPLPRHLSAGGGGAGVGRRGSVWAPAGGRRTHSVGTGARHRPR